MIVNRIWHFLIGRGIVPTTDDFGVLGNSWGTGPGDDKWYVLCDLYEDEQIDALDMAEFVKDWLWQADWYEP